ncbi:ABC-2 family transporter protein [Posidoniimonas polymericola]|uniref:ABC-2 family transporter protein n=1 Tax=Posidoniimonas polymericola TaxID=2528002 RepID=A0A5C5YAQ3_9BACT|nr:ABC transporter permease subunit [Posidoniimonas polymericola]TWT72786.1 ABC-2 family transporter protein [Posidoniimonas polymericola]
MYVRDNPVLQYELLSTLRLPRAFVLLFAYIALLGGVVLLAWPQQQKLDFAQPEEAKRLVELFFFGQFMLASLMAPSFAAGAITGEKERDSYEMLLASPIKPGAIVLGKLFASLTYLGILIFCSLPIVMLCLPLGGVGALEVFAAYIAMMSMVALFGMISLWASSYFQRTSASLVVSYLMILPLAMVGVLVWQSLEQLGGARVAFVSTVTPIACAAIGALLWADITRRLLYPADLGSGGKEVVDLETEAREAVGLYIKRDEFPDKLFAPPKRTTFIEDGANPIYDKEMRSEIFAQGTLMLRLVIQISMGLALPIMAVCLYMVMSWAPWYIAYVLLFNMLVGPVFSAGSVCNERERQTLDLLLTTLISPWQMLWGKLLSGLRVSVVLTSFLLWPVLLACMMPLDYWNNLLTMAGYFLVVALACLTTALTALFCSTIYRKTSSSLMTTYVLILTMFVAPLAARFFSETFYQGTTGARVVHAVGSVSPFAAVFALPLDIERADGRSETAKQQAIGDLPLFFGYVGWSVLYNLTLLLLIMWLFHARWRVSE